MMSSSAAAIVAFNLKEATNWWSDVNESPVWQDRIFHVLAVLYGIVSVIAVVPLLVLLVLNFGIGIRKWVDLELED